jgi:hypothetical protein
MSKNSEDRKRLTPLAEAGRLRFLESRTSWFGTFSLRISDRGLRIEIPSHSSPFLLALLCARLLQVAASFFRSQKGSSEKVGLTGFEPVTLRLSSACSNQLSYRPDERVNESFGVFRLRSSGWLSPGLVSLLSLGKPRLLQKKMEARGFEPLTYSLQSYRSTN